MTKIFLHQQTLTLEHDQKFTLTNINMTEKYIKNIIYNDKPYINIPKRDSIHRQ